MTVPNFPNIIAITGLEGVGRRTFIKDFLDKRLSLKYFAHFELEELEGIDELYRLLVDENMDAFSEEEMKEAISCFSSLDNQEKYEEVARLLAKFAESKAYAIIVDSGALLDNNGYYNKDFYNVLNIFAKNIKTIIWFLFIKEFLNCCHAIMV